MAAGMSRDAEPSKLSDRLGMRWALAETSFVSTPPAAIPTRRPMRCWR